MSLTYINMGIGMGGLLQWHVDRQMKLIRKDDLIGKPWSLKLISKR